MEYNPTDPNNVYEFQGGAFDGWYVIATSLTCIPLTCCPRGGSGYENCAILTGPDFERGRW